MSREQLNTAKAEVQRAREQLLTAREQLKTSRTQASTNLQTIAEERLKISPRKRIPFTPRKVRAEKLKYKRELSKSESDMLRAQQEISEQEKLLAAKEAELAKYEGEVLGPYEKELIKVEEYNAAVDRINRLADQNRYEVIALLTKYGKGAVREAAQKFLKYESLSKQSIQYVDELGQGISIAPELVKNYIKYETPYLAYYDPINKEHIFQSMDPKVADNLGLIKTQVTGFFPDTGTFEVKSDTGFLTPKQLTTLKFFDVATKSRTEIPTTFEVPIVPDKDAKRSFTFTPTHYEIAAGYTPYEQRQANIFELRKLGAEKFRETYGYEVDKSGRPLYSGGVSPVDLEIVPLTTGKVAGIGYGLINKIIPQPEPGTKPFSQLGRAGLFIGTTLIPGVGLAYGIDFAANLIYDPVGTIKAINQYRKDYPYEVYPTLGYFGIKSVKNIADKRALRALEENIKELKKQKITTAGLILKEQGVRPGVDRVIFVAEQNIKDGKKVIRIEGDLISQANNKIYFMPDAKGYSITAIKVQPVKLSRPRIYIEGQIFEVGSKSTGINLGTLQNVVEYFSRGRTYAMSENIANLEVYTPVGKSSFVPRVSGWSLTTQKIGLFPEKRFLRQQQKQFKKNIVVEEGYEIDYTLPFREIGIKLDAQTDLLIGEKDISLIKTINTKTKKIRIYGGKKTPLSKTFSDQNLISSQQLSNVARKTQITSDKIVSQILPSQTRQNLKGIPRMTGGQGLDEAQINRYISPSYENFEVSLTPKYSTRQYSRSNYNLVERKNMSSLNVNNLLLNKELNIVKERQLIRERQQQIQKSRQLQREQQALKQQQRLQQKLIDPITGKMSKSIATPKAPALKYKDKNILIPTLKKSKKKKKSKYKTLPTLSQQIIGYKGKAPIRQPKGFEAIRII